MTDRVLVCVAWPYANGDLHLGHIAGAYLPPDIFARYQRMRGKEAVMVSGSDIHGTPITIRADAEGISPREVVDRFHPRFIEAFLKLGITFDCFTETGTENHISVTQDMFLKLLEKGYIYKDTMKALHCPHCDRYLPDRYVEGKCPYPDCGNSDARGDQCDNCGRTLDAIELVDPRCKFCGKEPQVLETEHFFLDLAQFNHQLLAWIEMDKDHWRPNVLNVTLKTLQSGELRGRPITRDIKWGVPVPIEGYEDKRIYVWFDAVIGYLSATKEWASLTGDPEAWRQFWQEPSLIYNFIGKDNIPFHAIIWPAILMGYGELNLPHDVPANEYLTVEGRQLSKSRNWVIEALDFLQRYDPDPLRYILTINAPETRDTNFSWEEFVRRNNDELVATYGNLANRVLSFAYKNFDGKVPEPAEMDERDRALLKRIEDAFQPIGELIDACKFKQAITETMDLAHEVNRYLDEKAPWFQIKEDRPAAATTVYVGLRVIDSLKMLFYPFLPFSSQALHGYLGYTGDLMGRQYQEEPVDNGKHLVLRYDGSDSQAKWEPSKLEPGQALSRPSPLFKKLDESIVADEVARMERTVG
jgi:methionyl-tRNA synthetase